MISHKIYHTLLFKLLFYIVVFFPLILIFRSATINTITLLLPIFFLIYIKIAKINLINNVSKLKPQKQNKYLGITTYELSLSR